ncbi:hypothetical protein GCM10010298_55680 [Streptomyces microflavus]|nr:hypothetical protein GCM10010298_55680 [Streptomyces microflavus]
MAVVAYECFADAEDDRFHHRADTRREDAVAGLSFGESARTSEGGPWAPAPPATGPAPVPAPRSRDPTPEALVRRARLARMLGS